MRMMNSLRCYSLCWICDCLSYKMDSRVLYENWMWLVHRRQCWSNCTCALSGVAANSCWFVASTDSEYRLAIDPIVLVQHCESSFQERESTVNNANEKILEIRGPHTFSQNSDGLSTGGGTPPQPKMRDKSFPVPIGRIQTSGMGWIFLREISFKIQPMVPSPPPTRTRHGVDLIWVIKLSASFGPDALNSNICNGFNTLRNTAITLSAALSPDLLLPIGEPKHQLFIFVHLI